MVGTAERLLYPPVDQEGNDALHGDGRRPQAKALDGAQANATPDSIHIQARFAHTIIA